VNRSSVVVPVRLVARGRAVQSTSRVLTMEGVFVRCLAPPLPGVDVQLRLYLPDGQPEDLEGQVVRAPGQREQGCQVEFKQLSEKQHARLTRLLAPPMLQPGAKSSGASDHRSTVRVPAQLRVRFESLDAVTEQFTTDLSAGGMFVQSDQPPAYGSEVTLAIELPGEEKPIQCRALVVHRVSPEDARNGDGSSARRISGVGIQFLDADDRFREQIDGYLARAQGLTPIE
jgi:uncharacterized protein (TIGR02266 family)